MDIIINKDITKYKIERWKGFSNKQIVAGGGLLIFIGAGLAFFVYFCKVPLVISGFMLTPIAMVLVLLGFYEPARRSFWSYLKMGRNSRLLLYSSIRAEEQKMNESAESIGSFRKVCLKVDRFYQAVCRNKWVKRFTRLIALVMKGARYLHKICMHMFYILRKIFVKSKKIILDIQKNRKNNSKKDEEEAK